MALDIPTLTNLILSEMSAAAPISSAAVLANCIAFAVITHIQSNAMVDTTLPTLISPGGLTPAPVIGTAKII